MVPIPESVERRCVSKKTTQMSALRTPTRTNPIRAVNKKKIVGEFMFHAICYPVDGLA